MRRGSAEDAADFSTGFVKGYLESIYVRGLANVSKPSLCTVCKNGDNDGGDDAPPRN